MLHVNLVNRSVITSTCRYLCAILGNGPRRSIATNSKGPAAGNSSRSFASPRFPEWPHRRRNSVRWQKHRWPCGAISTPFAGYSTYACHPDALLSAGGGRGTVPPPAAISVQPSVASRSTGTYGRGIHSVPRSSGIRGSLQCWRPPYSRGPRPSLGGTPLPKRRIFCAPPE